MRMHWRWVVAALLGFWLWFYLPIWADQPAVQIFVRPRVSLAGQLVRLRVRVPQHPANRELWLEWGIAEEMPHGMIDRSLIQLDGDSPGTRMTYWFYREVTRPGVWVFVARVRRNDGSERIAAETVEVH